MLASLNAREVRIIYLRFYEDRPFAYIGRKLGVTESRVFQICDLALEILRARLAPAKPVSRDDLISQMISSAQRAGGYR